MAYTTADKVREVLTKVTVTVMSDANVVKHIARADAVVNSFVASRYSLPFAATPPLIEQISTDLSAYFVMRTLYTRDNQNKNDWIEDFRASMKMLNQIKDGEILLMDANNAALGFAADPVESSTGDTVPVFDLGATEDQQVDPDLIESIGDSKV